MKRRARAPSHRRAEPTVLPHGGRALATGSGVVVPGYGGPEAVGVVVEVDVGEEEVVVRDEREGEVGGEGQDVGEWTVDTYDEDGRASYIDDEDGRRLTIG